MPRISLLATCCVAAIALAGCGDNAKLPASAGYGTPNLPAPQKSLLSMVHIAPAVGWQNGETPTAAKGLTTTAFAQGLQHPRWLYVLPNGDVLVAESDAPPKPDDGKGIMGFVQKQIMKLAGSGTSKSANRITLLRDTNNDGRADIRTVFLSNLNSPVGMALVGDTLYVADTDAVLRFPYHEGQTQIADNGQKLVDLPAGTINHHWVKNVIASADGSKLYVSIGSNSNVGENGLKAEEGRAAIWEVDAASGQHRIFASGLRNPNGMGWGPDGKLWAVVNERDDLGGDLVPDYLTSVQDGAFYGWPFSYYGQHVDERVKEQHPEMVAKAIVPDYATGAHTATLGLTFADGVQLGPHYANGAFLGQHGSWNRKPFNGYRVAFVPFKDGKPSGQPQDVLTGFLNQDGKANGRPVGVAVDKHGGLLVADDVGNAVWRVAR